MNAEERQIYFEGFKRGKKDALEMCDSCKYKISAEDIKQIRLNVIDECIKFIKNSIPTEEAFTKCLLVKGLEQLKEQK